MKTAKKPAKANAKDTKGTDKGAVITIKLTELQLAVLTAAAQYYGEGISVTEYAQKAMDHALRAEMEALGDEWADSSEGNEEGKP